MDPTFIVGMPRSGTTLLRSMLSVHPKFAVSRETHFFSKWWKRYRHLNLSIPDNFDAFWEQFSASERFTKIVADPTLVKARILASDQIDLKTIFTCMMQVLAATMNKPRWAEKTPTHYKYLNVLFDWYPHARVVWMLRDPRAVVVSTLERWKNNNVEDCAARWRDSVLIFQEQWSEDERVRIVKYEELVSDTEHQMRKLCDFLGEKFFPEMIRDRTQVAERVVLPDKDPNKSLSRLANQSPTSKRTDRWRSALSSSQLATVEHISREAMLRCNYRLSCTNNPTIGQYCR